MGAWITFMEKNCLFSKKYLQLFSLDKGSAAPERRRQNDPKEKANNLCYEAMDLQDPKEKIGNY